jgi:hypothetical protein
MNWKRGFLLAAINVAAAVPIMVVLDVQDAQHMRQHLVDAARAAATPAPSTLESTTESGSGITFDPCSMTDIFPLQAEPVYMTNLPAEVLSGWRDPCARWTLSRVLHFSSRLDGFLVPTPASVAVQRKVDLGMVLLIVVQWILVGAFPLNHPRSWWRELGAFITLCGVIGSVLVLIHPVEWLGRLAAAFAACAWLIWFVFLIAKTIRFLFRRAISFRYKPA